MKKFFNILLCAILGIFLTSCGSSGGISTFTAAVEKMPTNFDPQIAEKSEDLLVLQNIFNGLYEKIDGAVVPVLAEDCVISEDGKTYTIKIKDDSKYYYSGKKDKKDLFNKTAVTANDFVFAFQRVLNPKTHSPYADDFSNISGAESVKNGADPSSIGVYAKDDYTLVINLSKPDYNFIEKLCLPAAFPCNEEFFNSTGGAYGLSVENILSNGFFRLNYIDENNATIVQNGEDKNKLSRIRIKKIDATEQPKAYANDEISGFFSFSSQNDSFENTKSISYNSSTISLLFNMENKYFSNSNIRKALAWYAFGFENSGANPEAVEKSETIFPDTINIAGEHINNIITPSLPSYLNENPKDLLNIGLSETGYSKLDSITILMPNDSDYSLIYENINQLWQKNLGQFFTIEYLSTYEIKDRISKNNFDIAFLPITPSDDTPYSVLEYYSSYSIEVNNLITQAKLESDQKNTYEYISNAQNIILQNAFVAPMGSEKTIFYYKNYFENISVDPFTEIINFKNTIAK